MVYADVIQESVAPAFLLGAVASFLSVLNLKFNRIIDQRNAIPATEEDPILVKRRKILTRRARFVNRATLLALLSAAMAATLIIASFAYALFGVIEQRGLPLLFTISLVFLGVAFIDLGREVFAARSEFKD